MATAPLYMGTAMLMTATCSTANTARDGTGTLATPVWTQAGLTTGVPSTDFVIKRLLVLQTADLASSMLTVFTWDGSAAKFLYDFQLSNPAASSATVTGVVLDQPLLDWMLPGGLDLRFGITAAPSSGECVVQGLCEAA
jgi:hypothetical protein